MFRSILVRMLVLTAAALSSQLPATAMAGDRDPSDVGEVRTNWIKFEKCPVLIENIVQVPAQDRGIVKVLACELNASVTAGQLLAELDNELAELALQTANLEYSLAVELAQDPSNVNYHQLALAKVEDELASYKSISTSVSEAEIRRLTLGVDQAKLSLVRAKQAQKIAIGEAHLKKAAVDVAELRLAQRRITAPKAGSVTAIKIQPGQAVEANQTILEIRNFETLMVDRLVPIGQFDVGEMIGADVRVDVAKHDGQITRLAGSIVSYDLEVSSSGSVRVHARVKNVQSNGHWLLLPGREVTMYVSHHSNADKQ